MKKIERTTAPYYNTDDKVIQLIKRTNQKDIDRLKDPNRKSITNWSNPKEISTHKMSWTTNDKGAIIYPEVQNIKGKLIDDLHIKNGQDLIQQYKTMIQYKLLQK